MVSSPTHLRAHLPKTLVLIGVWTGAALWLLHDYRIIATIACLLWIGMASSPIADWSTGNRRTRLATAVTHGVAALVPIVLLWSLYHTATHAGWREDDPMFLQSIAQHGIVAHFYDSELWRGLLFGTNLIPWATLSLGVDWHLFGIEPLGFYGHQLLSFSIVLVIAYAVLSRFFSPLICSVTLSVFVASVPSAYIASYLMTRHYLEGLGLSLLAIHCYVTAVRTQRRAWAYVGCLFYLLATTAKETYVPLVVVLPCLPVGAWRQRWKPLVPFVAVAATYVLWRAYMLTPGKLLTGYGSGVPRLTVDQLPVLVRYVPEILGWVHGWQLVVVLVAALVCVCAVMRNRSVLVSALVWTGVIVLPIVPVLAVSQVHVRYLFLPFFALWCVGIAYSLQWLETRGWRYVVVGLGLSVFAAGIESLGGSAEIEGERIARSRVESDFILTGGGSAAVLLQPLGHPFYYEGLRWLRRYVVGQPEGPRVCYDVCICQLGPHDTLYRYEGHELVRIFGYLGDCGRHDVDLTVDLYASAGAVHWQLGPFRQGQYHIAISAQEKANGFFREIPSQGSFPWLLPDKYYFVFKYVAPEGWRAYSAVFVLDPAEGDVRGEGRKVMAYSLAAQRSMPAREE